MQRYFSNEKENDKFTLNENDLYHIKVVMRMKKNDQIEVVYENKLFICELDDEYHPIIKKEVNSILTKKTKYVLCVPLLQEQKMSFVLQKATELGIDEIIPIITTRSVVKINDKEEKKLLRWHKICKEASEQSKRLDIPVIHNITNIENLSETGLKIICSTKEKENTIKKVLQNNKNYDRIVFVIGPEGGLTDLEEDTLQKIGFVPTSLGENIMRVETVPIYMLSVLNYETME